MRRKATFCFPLPPSALPFRPFHILLLYSLSLCPPLAGAPKSVTFYERSFIFSFFFFRFPNSVAPLFGTGICCRMFSSPSSPSSCISYCCCNFMLLTNSSLSGLLFTVATSPPGTLWRTIVVNVLFLLLMIN